MDELSASGFVAVARAVATATAAAGLLVPSFRSPPRTPGLDRAITRHATGVRVSVRRAGRPAPDVVEGMVEGVVAANELRGQQAAALRRTLRAAAWAALDQPAPAPARAAA